MRAEGNVFDMGFWLLVLSALLPGKVSKERCDRIQVWWIYGMNMDNGVASAGNGGCLDLQNEQSRLEKMDEVAVLRNSQKRKRISKPDSEKNSFNWGFFFLD
ncbi:hypothetical protein PpBr36_05146 [Pyricularia pennisetigena]|uniref:hypothetical protein n=1 Tax=Pyricularia pennisetigena TaxID=1578925 RepID=UPI00114E84AB|nr:hypothetical protein PpBr36_05146 [Pyricularia pennisetigena]TLS27464.1 hypothetical protein PpBr36_05146 [Pyricularia pennisetigena]